MECTIHCHQEFVKLAAPELVEEKLQGLSDSILDLQL
jgi:hypothetical protein